MVDDELSSSLEEVGQARPTTDALESVLLVDSHHRKAAALRRKRVLRPGVSAFKRDEGTGVEEQALKSLVRAVHERPHPSLDDNRMSQSEAGRRRFS